jgi:organic radical activating enzyme
VSEHRFNPQVKLATHRQFQEFVAGGKVYPINYEVCPTHVCQAKCSWCFYAGTHLSMAPDSVMDFDVAKDMMLDMFHMHAKAITWSGGGEPTLHPRFRELVELAHWNDLKQGLFTNGLSMPKYDPGLLEWIRVSNTDRDWNVNVLKEIRQKAKVLGMAINYVGDDDGIKRALEVADEAGVDYVQVRQALALRGYLTDRKPPEIDHPKLMITKLQVRGLHAAAPVSGVLRIQLRPVHLARRRRGCLWLPPEEGATVYTRQPASNAPPAHHGAHPAIRARVRLLPGLLQKPRDQ